jgi:hypothetical protein
MSMPSEGLHDLGVVGDLKVGHPGLAEALDLHVVGVVRADGHGGVDDIWGIWSIRVRISSASSPSWRSSSARRSALAVTWALARLGLRLLGRVLLGLAHQHADLFGQLVAAGPELIGLRDGGAAPGVQVDDLVHQGQLGVLEFLFDVLSYGVGILPDKTDIQHGGSPHIKIRDVSRETALRRRGRRKRRRSAPPA